MKLPIQPNTCACPCACIHARETVSTERWLLIASRFQTPRKVPGSSMKNKPLAMYAINNRDSRSSRAAIISTLSARVVFSSSTLISGHPELVTLRTDFQALAQELSTHMMKEKTDHKSKLLVGDAQLLVHG